MAGDNSAYDFFLQDNPHKPGYNTTEQEMQRKPEKEYQHAEPEHEYVPDISMKKFTPKKGSVFKIFVAAVAAMSVVFCVLYAKVEYSKVYNQISEENQKLEIIQSENVRLKSELESRMTLKNVEEYASKVLGLQKLDNSQIEYVQTQTDDVVEIPEEEKNVFVKIKDGFNRFIEYIFG